MWKEYKKSRENAKRFISLANFLNSKADGKRKTGYNKVKQKGVSGKVIVDDKGIKDSWKEYMEKLMNEKNEGIIECRLESKKEQKIV